MCDIEFLNWLPSNFQSNPAACTEHILNDRNWFMLPLINGVEHSHLQENQFVRFQGMIVDIPDPEYYFGVYEVMNNEDKTTKVQSGKYCDFLNVKHNETLLEDSPNTVTSERYMWYCSTDPFLNPWVLNYLEQQHPNVTEERIGETNKRQKKAVANTCLVKIYEKPDTCFSLNDIVEVAGFVNLQEIHTPSNSVEQELSIHAVAVRSLKHCNPLLPPTIKTDEIASSAENVRDLLHHVIRTFLLDDSLAADYLICHLLSTVYLRNDLITLGCLPLNLSGISPKLQFSSKLSHFLKEIVTQSCLLPMSLANLNGQSLVPRKNYDSGRLSKGLLQMSPHTHLILDETALATGQLDNTGVLNVAALGSLVTQQKIDYDFQYYKLGFNCNIPVLIVSEGKSLLQCPLELRMNCNGLTEESYEIAYNTVIQNLEPSSLDRIRRYLTAIRLAEFAITDELQEVIEKDFVELRQRERKTSPEDLHLLLVLARYLSLSEGNTVLTRKAWSKALAMEQERKQRLNNIHRTTS